MIRCVLVATDGSRAAEAAVKTGIELARSLGPDARLHVASAIDYAPVPGVLAKHPKGAPDLLADQATSALAFASAAATAAGLTAENHLLNGDIVAAILACAEKIGADIIVAGYHGHNPIVRLVMGTVVGNLVRSTTLPVVVVRPPG
jgi:nucleotide-binding universal stress UspA family protein